MSPIYLLLATAHCVVLTTSCPPARSDTERLYGWSGSRGGISNNEQGPKYRINSQGHLVLAEEIQKKKKETATSPLQANSSPAAVLGANNNGATPTKPALRTARSEGTSEWA